jgi:carbamoyl-phosphate synthase large subunit
VLSAGRRVELVQQFQAAARELLPGSLVLAGDASPELSAACQIADRSVRLPRVSDAAYRAELVAVCRSQSVGLIVPTTDTELLALASLRDVLEADGTAACVSDSSLVAACRDKRVTGDVFSAVDIPYPTVHDKHALTFPQTRERQQQHRCFDRAHRGRSHRSHAERPVTDVHGANRQRVPRVHRRCLLRS